MVRAEPVCVYVGLNIEIRKQNEMESGCEMIIGLAAISAIILFWFEISRLC